MYADKMDRGEEDPSLDEMKRPPTPKFSTNASQKQKPQEWSETPRTPNIATTISRTLPLPRTADSTTIMILGPSGSGKTSLINRFVKEAFPVGCGEIGPFTTKFQSSESPITIISGSLKRPFYFIDSPGFGTNNLSNPDILKQLVIHQAEAAKSNSGALSGVLYLHPQSENLACEKLRQNLEALACLFGESWLSHFTFAIVSDVANESDGIEELKSSSSPYHPFHAAGAKFRHLHLPFQLIPTRKVLLEFEPIPALEPRFYAPVRSNKITDSLMDELLAPQQAATTNKTGFPDKAVVEVPEPTHQRPRSLVHEAEAELKSSADELPVPRQVTTKSKISRPGKFAEEAPEASRQQSRLSIDEPKSELASLVDKLQASHQAITANKTGHSDKVSPRALEPSRQQHQPPIHEPKAKIKSSVDRLQAPPKAAATNKTGRPSRVALEEPEPSHLQPRPIINEPRTEHKLLLAQLEQAQLENAILRSELQLNDNTEQSKILQLLEDINHAVDAFGRSIAEYMFDQYGTRFEKDDPTTLDAAHISTLRAQFGHQGGKPSLLMSSKSVGLHIEDFLDFALRGFVLQKLCKDVFIPFHPTLTKAEPSFMSSLYKKVRGQASPAVAAKWRMSTFLALSMGQKLHESAINEQVNSLVTGSGGIQELLNNIFGRSNPVTLADNHRSQLRDIFTLAWEFNHVLKAEVLALGDFQPLFCEPGIPFDPTRMVAFEPNQRAVPEVALSTVKLGLTLSYSKESGNDANPSVILQATVVTPAVYG
ncbi:unnamed protein product [Rhizoctonia solani]|uniref:G domain-containing protein n=1 Tax=Rhizoctonia solani TaxID=456999 RepID=A0A8H3CJ00_9AGAM|nr:unnamed protein product [Rhizoctonia solani]